MVHVEVAKPNGVPLTLVTHATRIRNKAAMDAQSENDTTLQWDEVWAVFDVDQHPHITEARELARVHNIDLAVSNPNFELWALLHFQDQRAHIERANARAALQEHLPRYDKKLEFLRVHSGYIDAVQRARKLDEEALLYDEPGRNPTTGVYRLTESIRRKDF